MGFRLWAKCKRTQVGNSVAKSVYLYLATCQNETTGQCNPSQDRIADELEMCLNTVRRSLRFLEKTGFITRNICRKGKRVLGSNYVVNPSADGAPDEPYDGALDDVSPDDISRDDISNEVESMVHGVKAHQMHPNKNNKEVEIEEEKEKKESASAEPDAKTKKKSSSPTDPRSKHTAIAAVRELQGAFPDKILWDRIISRFGEDFDKERLTACRMAWVERGFNRSATTWLNWYFDGIPEYKGSSSHAVEKPRPKQPSQREVIAAEQALIQEHNGVLG